MSLEKIVEVRDSGIHGKGVFAKTHIKEGDYIGFYSGEETDENSTYVLWITNEDGNEFGIDGTSKLKYLNHSDEPNAGFDSQELYAERDINPGEEITFHYGDEFVEYLEEIVAS